MRKMCSKQFPMLGSMLARLLGLEEAKTASSSSSMPVAMATTEFLVGTHRKAVLRNFLSLLRPGAHHHDAVQTLKAISIYLLLRLMSAVLPTSSMVHKLCQLVM